MDKIAVHFHLYYLEQLDEILRRLSYLNENNYDLFVTMSKLDSSAMAKIISFKNSAQIWQAPNLGYDIGPFIDFLHKIKLSDYDYVLKIHTKRKNFWNYTLFNRKRFSISTLREMLLDSVLYSQKAVQTNLEMLQNNPQIGMIGNIFSLTAEPASLLPVATLAPEMEKLNLKMPQDLHFIAGTMFLVRANLLQPFLKYQINYFATSNKNIHDYTPAHVLERLFGLAVAAQGYKVVGVKYKSYRLKIMFDSMRRFLFQKKLTHNGKLIIKICKIPLYAQKTKA